MSYTFSRMGLIFLKKLTSKELFSIPNLLSYFRILLIPVICILYFQAQTPKDYLFAGLVVLFSSLTDLADGFIARHFNMITDLGKILDPVADKLTHAAIAVCLAVHYPLMWLLIILMLFKEGYMAYMGITYLKRGKMMNGAMWYGKVCTASLFFGLMILFCFPFIPRAVSNGIILVLMLIMAVTLCLYISFYRKLKTENSVKNL